MLYDLLVAPFVEFEFMRRALVGSCALALSSPLLGLFLVLRRMSLTGDAVAHAILPGAAIGFLLSGLSLGAMTIGGLAAGLLVAIGSGVAARATILREDATLAAFYLVSLALGVTLVSWRGSSIDLLHVLFGSVLALDDATLLFLVGVASVIIAAIALLYRALVIETVDRSFLASVSRVGGITQSLFLALVVLNLVAGFHALGTLLAVGMMMLPAASARLIARDLTTMIGIAAGLGMIASYAGLVVSYQTALPSGPLIILVAGGLYLLALVFGPAGGLVRLVKPKQHLEA
jgi:zinc/manganese transport system permease protein